MNAAAFAIGLAAGAAAASAQTPELVARVQAPQGPITLTAHHDGRATIALLRFLPLDVASGRLSMLELEAAASAIEDELIAGAGRGALPLPPREIEGEGITIRILPGDPGAIGARRTGDNGEVRLALGRADADSLRQAIRNTIRRTGELTAAAAPALVGAPRAVLERHDRGVGGGAAAAPAASVAAGRSAAGYRTVERAYFIALSGSVGGLVIGALAAAADSCYREAPCGWHDGGTIPTVSGAILGAAAAGMLASRKGRCGAPGLGRALALAGLGAVPGAMLAANLERSGLVLVPIGSAVMLLTVGDRCAKAETAG